MKYTKKPVTIEARQLPDPREGRAQADEFGEIGQWCGGSYVSDPLAGIHTVSIKTLEGEMQAQPGDYIIRGIKGEFYPCKADIFEATYSAQQSVGMTFSQALAELKIGRRVARAGWNGKGMFVFLVGGSNFIVNREPLLSIMGEGAEVTYRPHIDMKDSEGKIVPWLASQTDILADDWEIVSPQAAG